MIQTPMIHLNGSAAEDLLRTYVEAVTAVRSAIYALHQTAPNQRDYYPLPPQAFVDAVAQHSERVRKREEVRGSLEYLAEYCSDHV